MIRLDTVQIAPKLPTDARMEALSRTPENYVTRRLYISAIFRSRSSCYRFLLLPKGARIEGEYSRHSRLLPLDPNYIQSSKESAYKHEPNGGDLLQETLHALTKTTLQGRASKAGSASLRNVWRLNNPFVSDSDELQQAYRQTLMKHFTLRDAKTWADVASAVAKTVHWHARHQKLDTGETQISFNIQDVSRDATLNAVLQDFFGLQDISPERIRYIGTEIHRITIAKKKIDAGSTSEALDDLQRAADKLIDNLRHLFSPAKSSFLVEHLLCNVSGSSTDYNPLNLVIPVFEAPWRVTYYTLLAALQRGQSEPQHVVTLRGSMPDQPPPPAAQAVILETLRLYPPIRRVRRDTRVDIEAVQRDSRYWGLRAEEFEPARFLDAEGKVDRSLTAPSSAWMPFAVGSMRCPTAGGYSIRLIAVIVGELFRQMVPADATIRWNVEGDEWDENASNGNLLRAGRGEYGNVDLVVVGDAMGDGSRQ